MQCAASYTRTARDVNVGRENNIFCLKENLVKVIAHFTGSIISYLSRKNIKTIAHPNKNSKSRPPSGLKSFIHTKRQ